MAHWSSIMSHEKWQLHLRNDGSLIRTDHYFLDGYPRSEARMCHTRSLMQLSVTLQGNVSHSQHLRLSQHLSTLDVIRGKSNHCYDVMWKGNISMRTFLFLYMLRALGDRGYQKWVWSEITDGWWGEDTWPDMTTCYWYDGRHEAAPGVHNITMASLPGGVTPSLSQGQLQWILRAFDILIFFLLTSSFLLLRSDGQNWL